MDDDILVAPNTQGMTQKLKGALLEDDSESGAALQLIMAQIAQQDQTNRLMLQRLEQAETANAEQKEMIARLVEEKNQASQALEAAMEKMQQVMENRPKDPETTEQMVQAEIRRAKQQSRIKKLAFREQLKDMPKGTVYNHLDTNYPLTINGITIWFRPGKNHNVPSIFVEQWEKTWEIRRKMRREIAQMEGAHDYGEWQRYKQTQTVGDTSGDFAIDVQKFEVT